MERDPHIIRATSVRGIRGIHDVLSCEANRNTGLDIRCSCFSLIQAIWSGMGKWGKSGSKIRYAGAGGLPC